MKTFYPAGDLGDALNVIGYSLSQTLVETLSKAGNNLTREDIMEQAISLDLTLPMVYPGIPVKTAADDYYPIERMQPVSFSGTAWEPLGPVPGR